MRRPGRVAFLAYPSDLPSMQILEESAQKVSSRMGCTVIRPWRMNSIAGSFLSDRVLEEVEAAEILIADVSRLNFNVTFEVGYAIGQGKQIFLIRDRSLKESGPSIREVGIFDTLGYVEYENSEEIVSALSSIPEGKNLLAPVAPNRKAPVFVLDTKHKTDWSIRIFSRLKKARLFFRSFDPAESPRISAHYAITEVCQSFGVLVPFVSRVREGADVHNLRAAFVAGLAKGLGKVCTLMQEGDAPIPLDYRDFVKVTRHPQDVDDAITEFAAEVAEALQERTDSALPASPIKLSSVDLGASSAENEMRELSRYYLKTDAFQKADRGEAHLVVGRKGAGKTAVFLQIRDRIRKDRRNVVLDLKPDGYKLTKFRQSVLSFLAKGTYEHTITAFWEYVLLLEVAHKILQDDRDRHVTDHTIFDSYRSLLRIYSSGMHEAEGDFSERLSKLIQRISADYQEKFGTLAGMELSTPQITALLHKHDIRELEEGITSHLRQKRGELWLLFDNVDKGWPTDGLKAEDLLIIRALIEATRKLERDFARKQIEVRSVVFLRNDVYELLVRNTSDRGKEANVLLDWTDPELLRELVRLRILSNAIPIASGNDFESVWRKLCVSHVHGEESSQFLIDRSLMRPRFLLNLVTQCKGFAINLGHSRIEEDDILKGVEAYSADLLTDIGYEIRDILGGSDEVLTAFLGSNSTISASQLSDVLAAGNVAEAARANLVDLLLWYGYLGVRIRGETKYIYDVNYNIRILKAAAVQQKENLEYTINPAFWKALLVEAVH